MSESLTELNRRAEHQVAILRALHKADAIQSMADAGATKSCTVYFAQESGSGAIKIGVTCSLKNRLDMLRSNSPYDVVVLAHVPGDERLEKYVHDLFRESRIRGEWYRSTPELLACIEEVKVGLVLSEIEQALVEEACKNWAEPFAKRPERKRRRRDVKNRTVRSLVDEALSLPEFDE